MAADDLFWVWKITCKTKRGLRTISLRHHRRDDRQCGWRHCSDDTWWAMFNTLCHCVVIGDSSCWCSIHPRYIREYKPWTNQSSNNHPPLFIKCISILLICWWFKTFVNGVNPNNISFCTGFSGHCSGVIVKTSFHQHSHAETNSFPWLEKIQTPNQWWQQPWRRQYDMYYASLSVFGEMMSSLLKYLKVEFCNKSLN